MNVLIACEESQVVCMAFRSLGHEAYSCDIKRPSGGHPEWHILGDALSVLAGGVITTMDGVEHNVGNWDLLIAHPPCTYLSNAGARHLYPSGVLNMTRYNKGLDAKDFFLKFFNADIPRIAVENPIPSRIYCLPRYTQTIQPYEFGHPFRKKTCLWLKGLPLLHETENVYEYMMTLPVKQRTRIWQLGSNHAKERSKTFPGIAKAMAEQWG